MKILLPLLTILATLYSSVYCRYDVFFATSASNLTIGKNTKLFDCRYNSDKVVYCEVHVDYTVTSPERKCKIVWDKQSQHEECHIYNYTYYLRSTYRIRMHLTNLTNLDKCKNDFKSSSHLKSNILMYGNGISTNDLANVNTENGLPSSFPTYQNRQYYFKFETKKGCVFYGHFNKIFSSSALKTEQTSNPSESLNGAWESKP